jgi:hypothetical protein
LIFSDESGFILMPNSKRTWTPKGQTPKVHICLMRGRLNVMGALVVSPRQHKINLHALTTSEHRFTTMIPLIAFLQHIQDYG